VSLAHAEAGAKGGSSVRWREEPCPAELAIGGLDHPLHVVPPGVRTFPCQRPQKFAGDRYPGHRVHLWRGDIDGKPAELTWRAEP